MKYKLFRIPLYSPDLLVVVGKMTGEELSELIHKKCRVRVEVSETKEVEKCQGLYLRQKKASVMWLKSLEGKNALDTLAHEALHATIDILKFSGIRLTDSSEEAYTYLQGWITGTIWKWGRKC